MAHAQPASLEILLQHLRQFEQSQGIGNRGAVFAHIACHVLLPQVKLGLQALVSACLFQRVEVFALQVLQERQAQDFLVTRRLDERQDGLKAGQLRRPPAALTGNEFEAIMVTAHDNGLQESLRLEGTGEFLQPLGVEMLPRLIGIGVHVRLSYMVSSTPSMASAGLSFWRTSFTTLRSRPIPSRA